MISTVSTSVNQEAAFEEFLMKSLMEVTQIEEECKLYLYLKVRQKITDFFHKKKRNTDPHAFLSFILSFLHLPPKHQMVFEETPMTTEIYGENSMLLSVKNIESRVEHVLFTPELPFTYFPELTKNKTEAYLRNPEEWSDWIYSSIIKKAKSKAKRFRKEKVYHYAITREALKMLHEWFNIFPPTIQIYEEITYPPDFNPFSLTLEDVCERYVQDAKREREDTLFLDEKQLAEYMKHHLDKIEEGLIFKGTEIEVEDGRIDILCMDKDGVYVVIELKVADDKRSVWQSIYYPKTIRTMKNVEKVRFILISPEYTPSLLTTFEELPHVELYSFTPTIKNNQLFAVELSKVK